MTRLTIEPDDDVTEVVINPKGQRKVLSAKVGSTKTTATVKLEGVAVPPPPPDPDPEPEPEPEPVGRLPRLTRAYVDSLPRSGAAYQAVASAAAGPRPDLSNQDSPGSAAMLARGLLGDVTGVKADLQACVDTAAKAARVLSVGREAQPIALAALLTGNDPRPAMQAVLARSGLEARGIGNGTVRQSATLDPVNWGCHCRATIAWFAVGGSIPAAEASDNLLRYLTSGDHFAYKSDQQSWQPIPGQLVCIGPVNANLALDGVITNDAYRGGPPPNLVGDGANYTWEGFQGTVSAAIALAELGYDPFAWGDRAILRAGLWMYRKGVPATGDDRWIGWVLRKAYGSDWPHPLATPTSPGKGWGWTDWMYA